MIVSLKPKIPEYYNVFCLASEWMLFKYRLQDFLETKTDTFKDFLEDNLSSSIYL